MRDRNEGAEVAPGNALRSRIETIDAKFWAFPAGADIDVRELDSLVPELKNIAPGPERLRVAMERLFLDTRPAQHAGLQQAVRDFRPDVVVVENATREEGWLN